MSNDRSATRLYKERLNLLLDVVQTVNEDSDIEQLLTQFEYLLKYELHVGRIVAYTRTGERWDCLLHTNLSDHELAAINVERDLVPFQQIEVLAMQPVPQLASFDAIIPLFHKKKLQGYLLVGDSELGDGVSPTLRNLKFIQILANIILVFVENKKLQGRLLKQEALRRELEVASEIQAGLVPPEGQLLQTDHTCAMSYYRPHDQVGGDYFDVLQLNGHQVGFCMADVSGKGIAAAMLMSNFQAMVRTLFNATSDLGKLVRRLNERVCQNTAGGKFITLFLGRYNTLTGRLTYVNAGHLPPLLYRKSRNKVERLMAGCIGLGMLEEMPGIDIGHTQMTVGDLLVSYTDGLVEVEHGDGVGSNEQRLEGIVAAGGGIFKTMKAIEDMADETIKNGGSFDDTSVLAVEVTRRPFFAF